MRKLTLFKKSGFTLIEIIVSFTIFSILLGIVIIGFYDSKKLERLKQSSLNMVSQIQGAQNYALTGKTFEGEVPRGGYGVHFNYRDTNQNNKYIVFADRQYMDSAIDKCRTGLGNQRFDDDPYFTSDGDDNTTDCSNPAHEEGGIAVNEVISGGENYLQDGVIIYKIMMTQGGSETQEDIIDIAFKSPRPISYVGTDISDEGRDPNNEANFDSKSGRTVSIYLKLKNKDNCRKVTVFGSTGRVKEEGIEWDDCKI